MDEVTSWTLSLFKNDKSGAIILIGDSSVGGLSLYLDLWNVKRFVICEKFSFEKCIIDTSGALCLLVSSIVYEVNATGFFFINIISA